MNILVFLVPVVALAIEIASGSVPKGITFLGMAVVLAGVLSARGRAALAVVDGVPAGYLEASHRGLPREQWDGFDAQVRGLYERMVAITVTPEWAKLIDFETTLPSAVERLLGERQHRG